MDLKVALKDFIPVVRGNTLRDAPRQINPANIYSVQVMISKYEYDGERHLSLVVGATPALSSLSGARRLLWLDVWARGMRRVCVGACAGALNPNFQEGPFSLDFGAVRALK